MSRGERDEEESRVAVILPTFNRAKLLPTALSSLLKQTVRPSQLIVVNDGSTDQSSQIVEQFAKDAPFRVTTCNNPRNRGIGYSRQAGAEKVREDIEYVCYISDDDTWHPQFLAHMLKGATLDRITYCYYEIVDLSSGRVSFPFRFPVLNSREEFLRTAAKWSLRMEMFVNFSCVMISRTILREVPFRRDFRKGEDLAFFLDCLCSGVEYQCVEEVLARVGFHRAMWSWNWNLEDRRKLLIHVTGRLRELGVSNDLILYAMNDQRRWARLGRDEPIRKIRRLPVSLLLRLPPTRKIGQLILRHDRETLDRRLTERLEATQLGALAERGSVSKPLDDSG